MRKDAFGNSFSPPDHAYNINMFLIKVADQNISSTFFLFIFIY